MRHRKAGSKFNRNSSHRKAMFRNMVTSLLKYERIKTTDQKAKVLRGWADHIITLAKRGDLHARRQALAIIPEKAVVHKVFEEAPKRFAAVSGGYTRVIKLGRRHGDAAMMSLIELVAPETKQTKKKKAAKKKTTAKTAPVKETVAETTPEADSVVTKSSDGGDAAQAETDTVEEAEVKADDTEDEAMDASTAETSEEKDAQPEDSDK